jgi:hypothetical protein
MPGSIIAVEDDVNPERAALTAVHACDRIATAGDYSYSTTET